MKKALFWISVFPLGIALVIAGFLAGFGTAIYDIVDQAAMEWERWCYNEGKS